MGRYVGDSGLDNEAGQIAHSSKQVSVAVIKKGLVTGQEKTSSLFSRVCLSVSTQCGHMRTQDEMLLRIFGQRNRNRRRCSVLNSFM
jgi:hypothetical protein